LDASDEPSRIAYSKPDLEIVAINDVALKPDAAYLLQYDSVYRRFPAEVGYDEKVY